MFTVFTMRSRVQRNLYASNPNINRNINKKYFHTSKMKHSNAIECGCSMKFLKWIEAFQSKDCEHTLSFNELRAHLKKNIWNNQTARHKKTFRSWNKNKLTELQSNCIYVCLSSITFAILILCVLIFHMVCAHLKPNADCFC